MNPSQFDPSEKSKASTATNTNVPPPKEKDINDEAASAVKTTRVEIFLQPKITFDCTIPNATKIIKTYLFQLRKADAMIKINPIDAENKSQSVVLESETELPDNQLEMEPWVQNIKVKGKRLFFDLRVSAIDFEGLKAHLFAWSKCKGNYTTISKDKKISELFYAGWLHGISARFCNRDHIYDYIIEHKPDLKDMITVYAKEVYYYRADNSKIKAYAVAIDSLWEK